MWLWLKGFNIKSAKTRIWVENVIVYIYPSRCAEPKCGSLQQFPSNSDNITCRSGHHGLQGKKQLLTEAQAKEPCEAAGVTPHTSHLESWTTPADAAVSICSGKKTLKKMSHLDSAGASSGDFPPGMLKMLWQMVGPVEEPERCYSLLNILHALQIIYFICTTLREAGCWVMQLELFPIARRVKVNLCNRGLWSDISTKKCIVQTRQLKALMLHSIDLWTKETCVYFEGFSLCLRVQPVVCKKWTLGLEIPQNSRLVGCFRFPG